MRNYRKRLYLTNNLLLVDAIGTQRRIKALSRMGWTMECIGSELGVSSRRVSALLETGKVSRVTASRVAELYERWSMQEGKSTRARSRAEAKGWAPPLAYDEGAIDDPRAVPSTEIEAAHAEALREVKLRYKREERRKYLERLRQNPEQFAEYRRKHAQYKRDWRNQDEAVA